MSSELPYRASNFKVQPIVVYVLGSTSGVEEKTGSEGELLRLRNVLLPGLSVGGTAEMGRASCIPPGRPQQALRVFQTQQKRRFCHRGFSALHQRRSRWKVSAEHTIRSCFMNAFFKYGLIKATSLLTVLLRCFLITLFCRYNSSKKDNDFIYHEKIPSLESLPEVKGRLQ